MEKYIYKITNKINGKSYIGQTTDYKRRFQEHKAMGYNQEDNKLLYLAFKKYGIENFDFEIIENKTSNYNEKEKYWIQYYHSWANDPNHPNQGYNMTPGGDEPPLHIREESPFAAHTEKQVSEIKDLLINSKLQYIEIGKMYNYSKSAIERINNGRLWRDENLSYPLRKEKSRKFQEERAKNITQDLLTTKLTQKEIAKKYGCARTTVTAINQGVNFPQPDLTYPLRK